MNHNIYLQFENKIYTKTLNINTIQEYTNNDIKIIDIFIDILSNHNHNHNHNYINYYKNNYFFIQNGKIVNSNDNIYTGVKTHINNKTNTNNITYIECYRKQKGGDFLDDILSIFDVIFDVIFKPIKAIGNAFIFLLKLLFWFLRFIVWFIRFVMWIFTDLLDPGNLLNDFYNSLMLILYSLCNAAFNIVIALLSLTINTIGGWMQGIWGWDMSGLTKQDKDSKYFKSFNRTAGQKSYVTNTNTVPFSIILGTILCPPMGVFMDLGTTGWINIIVCCLLTMLFYLPGLCYAFLIIYS